MIRIKSRLSQVYRVVGFALLTALAVFIVRPVVYAVPGATILERAVQLSNQLPGQASNYVLSLTVPVTPSLGSIKVEFCENSPLFEQPCDAPAGFSLSGASITSQSGGDTGFSIHPSSTANTLVLSRTPGASSGLPTVFVLQDVVNASVIGTQYARYSTYAANDGSGALIDQGAVAFVLNPDKTISTEVPPFLDFCLATVINSTDCSDMGGSYLQMGDFSTTQAAAGQLQMVIGTNAANGYMVNVSGQTMASGTNTIPPLGSPTASAPGTSQFGINLRANSNPAMGADPSGGGSGAPAADYNIPNRFVYRSGDVVASRAAAEDYRKYTITYLVNISKGQPAGIYASSFTYTALGNF